MEGKQQLLKISDPGEYISYVGMHCQSAMVCGIYENCRRR